MCSLGLVYSADRHLDTRYSLSLLGQRKHVVNHLYILQPGMMMHRRRRGRTSFTRCWNSNVTRRDGVTAGQRGRGGGKIGGVSVIVL